MKFLSVAEIVKAHPFIPPPLDLQGWNSDHPLFANLIETTKPKAIIEVGTWKGRSALHMAELTKDLGTKIYCVDTWLGVAELTNEDSGMYGYTKLWYQFLSNASASPHADRIFPIPQTSVNGAKLLYNSGVRGDLIYIDGDHTYDGCMQDLKLYSGLIAEGGTIFGDDFKDFLGVRLAVSMFAFENNAQVKLNGPAWILS